MDLIKQASAAAAAPGRAASSRAAAAPPRSRHLDESPLLGKKAQEAVELLELLPHIKRLMSLQVRTHLACSCSSGTHAALMSSSAAQQNRRAVGHKNSL
jgi:hypothetical protein